MTPDTSLTFRQATADDALFIARGFHMAMLYDDAPQEQIETFARHICVREDVLYSWRNTLIAEVDGTPIGMLTAYDGRYYRTLRLRTMELIKEHLGVEFPGMEDEAVAGEYYLDSLAVMSPFRGKGIGRQLLQQGIASGQSLGLNVTLAVDPSNDRARALYSSLGFQPCGTLFIFGHDYDKMVVLRVSDTLRTFIETEIIPRYAAFDEAHQEDHARSVMTQSMALAAYYDVKPDMILATAAYHDLGLEQDRATHHLVSGSIVRSDERLRRWFSEEEIETLAQAVEDHRASADHAPRSIYGKIVAEADRLIDTDTILRRTLQYGFKHYPTLDHEAHIQRALDHLDEKYAEGGYLRLWIPQSPNAERLRDLQQLIKDRPAIRHRLEEVYQSLIVSNHNSNNIF